MPNFHPGYVGFVFQRFVSIAERNLKCYTRSRICYDLQCGEYGKSTRLEVPRRKTYKIEALQNKMLVSLAVITLQKNQSRDILEDWKHEMNRLNRLLLVAGT